jgi:ATP-binding cassette subfamily F protein 2
MPEHVDIYHLRSEIAASDMSAIDSVLAVDDERAQIEAEAHKLGDLLAELDGVSNLFSF